jgi:acyl dehydratase
MTETVRLSELPGLAGRRLGPGRWHELGQARIGAFADASGDRQWIHVDPERAAAGPFGRTIAHGYLTLALGAELLGELLEVEDATLVLNYGLNRVRFPAPVPSEARIRVTGELVSAEPVADGVQAVIALAVEVEGSAKPACVAEVVFRYLSSPPP